MTVTFEVPPVDWTNVVDTLRKGRAWMDVTPPDGAVLQHHGIGNYCGGGLRITFAPNARMGNSGERNSTPEGTTTIIFHLRVVDLNPTGRTWADEYVWRPDPFDEDTVDRLRRLVVEHVGPVVDEWNGAPFDSWSCVVEGGTAAARSVANYHDRCPEHSSVFCGRDGCNWYSDGRDLVPEPGWVHTPRGAAVAARDTIAMTPFSPDDVRVGVAELAEFLGMRMNTASAMVNRWPLETANEQHGSGHPVELPLRELVVAEAIRRSSKSITGLKGGTTRLYERVAEAIRQVPWATPGVSISLGDGVALQIELRWPYCDGYLDEPE